MINLILLQVTHFRRDGFAVGPKNFPKKEMIHKSNAPPHTH